MIDLYYNLTAMIMEAGGFEKLAERLEYEWSENFIVKPLKPVFEKRQKVSVTYQKFSPVETKYILDNYNKLSMNEMSQNLKITYNRLYSKVIQLKKNGRIHAVHNNS